MLWSLLLAVALHWFGTNTRIYLSDEALIYRKRHWLLPIERRIEFAQVKEVHRVRTQRWGDGAWDRLEVTYDDRGTLQREQISLVPFSPADVGRIVRAFTSRWPSADLG